MSGRRWANVSYLDAIRPDPAWRTEFAFLASYSADLVALVAVLLALAGLDDDRGSGSKVDFASAIDLLTDRVRLIAQAGRLVAPAKTPKILAILDRYVRAVSLDEEIASWHPKAVLVKQSAEDGETSQWRLWIGSRNLTRDLSWDVGLSMTGRAGGQGAEIYGIPEFGQQLAQHAGLPGVTPDAVKSELRRVRWDAPPGCTVCRLQLMSQDTPRGLPHEPSNVRKLIIVSPFLDGTVVGHLGRWGGNEAHRTLVSTRVELTKLAVQAGKPLEGFHELLFFDAPPSDDQPVDEVSDRGDGAQDEEPEPRGLHAKLIYAEGSSGRLLWAGSPNATQRGWMGPNTEVVAELHVTREVAVGLDDFLQSASTIHLGEFEEPAETDQTAERLELARKQVTARWEVIQNYDGDVPLLSSPADPNSDDAGLQLSVGLLGCVLVLWPRGAYQVRLPQTAPGEATELILCRLTLGDTSVAWLQRAPMEPPPSDERDRHAIARYLDPRTFLLWVRSLLTGESAGDGTADWDDDSEARSQSNSLRIAPSWWAPTIEEVLMAWTRDPSSLVEIDRKVRQYLRLYREQGDPERTDEERQIIEEFEGTWQVVRRELIREVR